MTELNMEKGVALDLKKEDGSPVTKIRVGGGWDPVDAGATVDGDLFVFDENGNVTFYNNKTGVPGTELDEDNLDGEGEGADENITLDVAKMTSKKVVIGINIFEAEKKGQDFSQIKNLFVEVEDLDNKQMLGKHDISSDENAKGMDALIVGTIEVVDGKLKYTGEYKYAKGNIQEIANQFKPTV